jgi:PAS domain S-box-containing protein
MNQPHLGPMHERIFELLVESVRDYAVFVLDPEGRVRTWNAGAQLLTGYFADEIIGKHFSIFYPPEAIATDWPAEELKAAMVQGRFEDEGWRLRKDGSRFWANVIITTLRDEHGHLIGYSKITRDLTARRQAEEELRLSEERFRLLIEGVQDYAIYMLDPHGVVSSWNVGAQTMTGYARDEVIGKHFAIFFGADEILAGRPWEEIALAQRTGRSEAEGWRYRKDGERFWARVVLTSLHDREGRLRGFTKVTQDLSQREHARDLERTAERMNEFIAMVAHELRNPLAPIRTAAHLMLQLPRNDPAQEEMRRMVDRQSSHLMRLVDDLLDIARVTRGTLSISRSSVDLSDVVARAVEIAKPGIDQANHSLAVELPPGPFPVTGDSVRLTQALANLLTNATRFTPSGGRITLKGERSGGYALLSVRDNGLGIAAENLENIFGMFVQGKEPIQRVTGGLGIGLALARRIVELHAGTIEARSEGKGKGSEFIVRLPLGPLPQQVGSPRRPQPAEPRPAPPERRRVLIVDDNVDGARSLDELMRSMGHTTRVAHEGSRALSIAEEFEPEIVLLDIGLPDLSGYEVARHLRDRSGESVKIVAITGWGNESDRARTAQAGFDLHLVKPVDESELQRAVEELRRQRLH